MKLLTFLFSLLLLPSFAGAVDYELVAGQEIEVASVVGGTDTLDIIVSANRCYCCEAKSFTNSTAGVGFTGGSVVGDGSPTLNNKPRAATEPLVNFSNSADPNNEARVCFNVSNDSDPTARHRVSYGIRAGSTGTSTRNNVKIKCEETTLAGGFNTSVTDYNFLEITNTLTANAEDAGSISGFITAKNAINDSTVINKQTFTVGAQDRVDVDVHSAAGAGAFGPVFICHDGPPNSVRAVTSFYNITTAPDFEPVAQVDFKTVGGN